MTLANSIRLLLVFSLLVATASARAFDNDFGISDIVFKDESFLDINAHAFRKSLDIEWRQQLNGWRMGGGSTSTDRAFINTELRLYHELSRTVAVSLDWEQDEFYAPKPTPAPRAAVNIYPLEELNIGFAIQGEPDHDKRQSDLGFAVLFGRRPDNYLRLSVIDVDKYWNDKNEFDDSFYRKFGKFVALDGAYDFNDRWQVSFNLEQDQPLDFVFDDQVSSFQHESEDYQIEIVFRQTPELTYGLNLRSLDVDKRLSQAPVDQAQTIDYRSLDLFRISPLGAEYELTLGLRYDNIIDEVTDATDAAASYEFSLVTSQVYATLFHQYSAHQAWDLGLYIGDSDREKMFAVANPDDVNEDSLQGKFRASWQYHSLDKSAVFLISITLNLDDLIDDPGDGGGMYFQKRF